MPKLPWLSSIRYPADLKKVPREQLAEVAAELREKIVRDVSRTGGHLASSLGVIELTIALHYVFDCPEDRFVWDVGHQAYAHKILTGRGDAFAKQRTWGGISGFPRISESPYDAFGTGHSGTSISAALGLAAARDLDGKSEPRRRGHRGRLPLQRACLRGAEPGGAPGSQPDRGPERQRVFDLPQCGGPVGIPEPHHDGAGLHLFPETGREAAQVDAPREIPGAHREEVRGADQGVHRPRDPVRGAGVHLRRPHPRARPRRPSSRPSRTFRTWRARCSSTWSPPRGRGTRRRRPTRNSSMAWAPSIRRPGKGPDRPRVQPTRTCSRTRSSPWAGRIRRWSPSPPPCAAGRGSGSSRKRSRTASSTWGSPSPTR